MQSWLVQTPYVSQTGLNSQSPINFLSAGIKIESHTHSAKMALNSEFQNTLSCRIRMGILCVLPEPAEAGRADILKLWGPRLLMLGLHYLYLWELPTKWLPESQKLWLC